MQYAMKIFSFFLSFFNGTRQPLNIKHVFYSIYETQASVTVISSGGANFHACWCAGVMFS